MPPGGLSLGEALGEALGTNNVQLIVTYLATKGNLYMSHICSKGDTCISHCFGNTL
jgi:hypothetical protein